MNTFRHGRRGRGAPEVTRWVYGPISPPALHPRVATPHTGLSAALGVAALRAATDSKFTIKSIDVWKLLPSKTIHYNLKCVHFPDKLNY